MKPTALQFLKKVVRMRKQLIRTGNSNRNVLAVCEALRPLDNWLSAYPNAPEHGALKMLQKYKAEVMLLMPGQQCKTHNKLMEEFNQLTNTQIS